MCYQRTIFFYSNSTCKWRLCYYGHEDIIIDAIQKENLPFRILLGLLDRDSFQIEDKSLSCQF